MIQRPISSTVSVKFDSISKTTVDKSITTQLESVTR